MAFACMLHNNVTCSKNGDVKTHFIPRHTILLDDLHIRIVIYKIGIKFPKKYINRYEQELGAILFRESTSRDIVLINHGNFFILFIFVLYDMKVYIMMILLPIWIVWFD